MAAYNINTSLGHYSGPKLETKLDQLVVQRNIVLAGQVILPTNLPSTGASKILCLDAYGRMVSIDSDSLTDTPTLYQVTHSGNATDIPIEQARAQNNNQLATLGQVFEVLADMVGSSPDIINLINYLIELIQEGDPNIAWILDELNNKVDKSQLGYDVQQLTLQNGERRLPLNQAPLLTLQHICQNGSNQQSRVSGFPAAEDDEFVTLGQVVSLIQTQSLPDLNTVLEQGNESSESIILSYPIFDISNTISPTSMTLVGALSQNRQSTQIYAASGITLKTVDTGTTHQAQLLVNDSAVGSDSPEWHNRLITNFKNNYTGIILTSADFGHNPQTGLSIDADKLDGMHQNEFISKVEFPLGDISSVSTGQTLIYNGTHFVPGNAGSGPGSGLNWFEDLFASGFQTLYPKNQGHNLHLQFSVDKNIVIGTSSVPISGENNILFTRNPQSEPGQSIVEGYGNFGFFEFGQVFGDRNVVFTEAPNLIGITELNFLMNVYSTIGKESESTSNNILINFEQSPDDESSFNGSDNLLINAYGIHFPENGFSNNTYVVNSNDVSVSGAKTTTINSQNVICEKEYQTTIGQIDVVIGGVGQFVQGEGITTNTHRAVVFGTYPTLEAGSPQQEYRQLQDRQFVVGSGVYGSNKNALTLWKSGQMKLDGQLKIGTDHNNETGAPIEGMLRYDSTYKVLEIYRDGTWTKDLLNLGLSAHDRLHDIDSSLDHAAVQPANRGKYLFTDPSTGYITFVDQPGGGGGGVTPISGILEWQTNVYRPYSSKTNSQFYTGQTVPTSSSTTLNYDGIFRATNLYVGGTAVLTAHPNEPANGSLHAVQTTTHAGFLPQLPTVNQTSTFLRGDGTWQSFAGGGGGTILTDDELAAIQNANTPSINNPFATIEDLDQFGQAIIDYDYHYNKIFSILDTNKSIQELFPAVTINNHEMNMFIPVSNPGTPEFTGTPIKITQIDFINHEITVDFFPYFDGEDTNETEWLISRSVISGGGTEPATAQQDQQYAQIVSFVRTGKGGVLTYNPSVVRNIGTWAVNTEIYYINIKQGWNYNLGHSDFLLSNNPIVGSWTKSAIGQAGFYRTNNGDIRLIVNGYNSDTQKRSIGLAIPTNNDMEGPWTVDASPRILYSDAPAWCQGSPSSGPAMTSVIKSPTEDCFIGYFNTYTSPRQIGYVKFNDDMSWFQFGEDPLIPASGFGAYQPSVIFFNGKYHMTLAELNGSSDINSGLWTLGHYESVDPLFGWERKRTIDTQSYRDIKNCYRSNVSTEVKMFIYAGKLYAFIDGSSRWNAAGNRGQRNIGLMSYDEVNETWIPYGPGPVFAGYQFANFVWDLPFGHTGAIPSLIVKEGILYFATALTQATDNYKIIISSKQIK